MLISSLSADVNEFLNSLYNADRKTYIVKRVGPLGAGSGNPEYTELEDEAWKEFSLHFPFAEWKEKIIIRPDIARKIKQLRDAKLDEIEAMLSAIKESVETDDVVIKSYFENGE